MFLKVPIESVCCKKYGICGEQYETDIVFHKNGEIKASRFRFQHAPLNSQATYIDSMRDMYHIIDEISKKMVPMMNDDATMSLQLPTNTTDASVQVASDDDFVFTSDTDFIDSSDTKDNDERLVFPYSLFYIYYD
jgi:hypothetical protein